MLNTHFAGLGSSKDKELKYVVKLILEEHRSKVVQVLKEDLEETYVRHASCLARQGVWTHWSKNIPFDFSWTNLIYGPGPRVIAFVLNAQINSVRTPDMLKLWGTHLLLHVFSVEKTNAPCTTFLLTVRLHSIKAAWSSSRP